MSRTIAGVFNFPWLGLWGSWCGLWLFQVRYYTPYDKAGRGLKPAGGPLE